jgi:beta-phosphoglucomutase
MTTKKAIIWDMDGTLVDTAELHFESWRETAQKWNRPFTRQDFAATFGRRNPEIIGLLFGEHVTPEQGHFISEEKETLYRSRALAGVELLRGAPTLLNALRAAEFRQAIGSSAPRKNLRQILELTETTHYFDACVGMEDTQRGKPDPEVFLTCAKLLNVSPKNCIVFEDAAAGVQAAKSAGMKCVAILFRSQHSQADLLRAGADLVVKSLEEITPNAINSLLKI